LIGAERWRRRTRSLTSRQKRKGGAGELEFAKLINGTKTPLSGALGGDLRGDVVGMELIWEVKRRADGFKQLYGWLEKRDALALRADRKGWLVVMPLETFLEKVKP
jgi:hypothetical protein